MKRKLFIVLALVILLSAIGSVSAQIPAPGTGFQTAFNIQNLSSNQTTCAINFYSSAGVTPAFSIPSVIIAGNDQADFYTGNDAVFGGMSPGQYSAVVSCDQEVAAVVNYSDGNSAASSAGLGDSAIGTSFFAPGIYDNYYNFYSNIVVQNTTGSSVNITVDILGAGGSVVKTYTANNVPAYASVAFDQTNDPDLNTNVPYSARITGTGNLAAVVNIYGLGNVDQQLYAYNPFAAGATEMFAPIIMNNYYGYNSALSVQNIDTTQTANVTVTYSNGATETANIGPGSAHVFLNFLTPGLPAGNTLYSAKVESTNAVPVVALVNQSNNYNRAASYIGFASGAGAINTPIVLRQYYGYESSITCQNLSPSANASININYSGVAGTTTLGPVAPNGTASIVQLYDTTLNGVGNNWIGSAVITANQDVVCVVNQDIITGPGATTSQDVLQSYEGIGN